MYKCWIYTRFVDQSYMYNDLEFEYECNSMKQIPNH